jgi:hypothetical protein
MSALSFALVLSTGCAREAGPAPALSARPEPVRRAAEGTVLREQAKPPVRPASAPPRVTLAPAPPPSKGLSDKLTHAPVSHLVALGDLHGDLVATRRALRLVGAIDEHDDWAGGELTLVQTGDVLDRGDDDRAILDLLLRLRTQAAEAGGEVLLLSGNHELMNVQLNFGYVTSGGFTSFGGEAGRISAFRPGGVYAQKLAQLPIVLKVGDTVFVHGGILPEHVAYGLDRMNDEVQRWMRGELFQLPAIVNAGDGLLWTRVYSSATDELGCEILQRTLTMLDAKRMVVGHTPQLQGITSACDDKVWRIDVGMSRYYGGPVQALAIKDGKASVLREP